LVNDISVLEYLINLNTIYFPYNYIFDITPLINNSGFENNTNIDMRNNYLNLSENSRNMNDIQTLIDRGFNIVYTPQRDIPQDLKIDYDITNAFEDENLLKAIRKLIGKPFGTIMISDIYYLENLDLSEKNIKSIQGLQYFENLEILEIYNNQITDITPLKNLINLKRIEIYNNQISDISPLKDLKKLIGLSIAGNKVTNIKDLENLTNMLWLNICFNQITDISALEGMINLRSLAINNNRINDLTPLINNSGIGINTHVDMRNNFLDLTKHSQNMIDIQTLIDRGINVVYIP
jgi:Leucine-rich repeat (LRR) protein